MLITNSDGHLIKIKDKVNDYSSLLDVAIMPE